MSLLLKALQTKLASSGLDWIKLESLQFCSRDRKLVAEISLAGEELPLHVQLHYSLSADHFLTVEEVETSRKWITEALRLGLVKSGNRFPLPGGIKGKLLRVLL